MQQTIRNDCNSLTCDWVAKELNVNHRYLYLPVQNGVLSKQVKLIADGQVLRELNIELAEEMVDFWVAYDLSDLIGKNLCIEAKLPKNAIAMKQIILEDDQPGASEAYLEKLRPQFHFTSYRGWLSNPTGLFVLDGSWHMFYQHNPYSCSSGNMQWGHAVSKDLLQWKEIGDLRFPQHNGDFAFGGCAVVDTHNTSGFGNNGQVPIVAVLTSTKRGACIVYSNDKGATWSEYEENPIIIHAGATPRLLWHDGTNQWVALIRNEAENGNSIVFYTSSDLKHWQLQSRMEGYKESTDLIELPVDGDNAKKKWVLYSANGEYSIGDFDGKTFVAEQSENNLWYGCFHAAQTCSNTADGRCIQIGWGQGIDFPGMPFNQQMTVPVELKLVTAEEGIRISAVPVKELQNLRIWKRRWKSIDLKDAEPFSEELTFRVAPGRWPDIRIIPAEGSPTDIKGDLFEVQADIRVGQEEILDFKVCGTTISWSAKEQIIRCKNVSAPLAPLDGTIKLCILLDKCSMEIFTNNGQTVMSVAVSSVVDDRNWGAGGQFIENTKNFSLVAPDDKRVEISGQKGSAKINSLEVYCLRSTWQTPDEKRIISEIDSEDSVVYESKSYTVFSNKIEDKVYGDPSAWVPDRDTIISPTRAVEEFEWRDTPYGDMTRVIERSNIWHPKHEINRFPDLQTGFNSVDAAYRLALDIFYRCGTEEFALRGEKGFWSAGQQQGPGEGFGVWVRDTAHVGLRAGNLLDPEGARRTLIFITKSGFENGTDGVAMPIVGIWDYYLATGDTTIIMETWYNLKDRTTRLDERFDAEMGLVRADHSTSNDFFPEPENGGFSLATEIYFMEAFRAMARMGEIMNEDELLVSQWHSRGEQLLDNIRKLYWKESAGFFTCGPVGSEAYSNNYWETAGQEGAIWPRFGIGTQEQRCSVLNRLHEVAMNEFGVNVFPYRKETNHFCNAAWVSWTAGIAAAAGREGRMDILMELISQQVRNCIINKTFHEVIDFKTGRSWRWPGQLWHAAGFISNLYFGVFGIEYNEKGLFMKPAVPERLANIRLDNFHYRRAVLDISVNGYGLCDKIILDNNAVDYIPAELEGRHSVELLIRD